MILATKCRPSLLPLFPPVAESLCDGSGKARASGEPRVGRPGTGAASGRALVLPSQPCTGYQAQKKEDQPWVVWWFFSDTIWARDSDLFGAEEARLSEREWPVESADMFFCQGSAQ